jgi:glycosyltransferase involved in cell wall biosynthesis
MVPKMVKVKIFKITTVPISLKFLLKGQMAYLNENGYEVYTISSSGPEIPDLYKSEKIKEHFSIALDRKITPLKDIIAIFQCYKLIKHHKPDIIHTYTPKAGLIGMISGYLAGCKIRIHNVTGLPLMEKPYLMKLLLSLIEKVTYACSNLVIVNSKGLMEYINSNISQSGKIKILGHGSTNGINASFFKINDNLLSQAESIKSDLQITDNNFVWIFIGRLVKDKGINELISAFEDCSFKFPSMKLILVGEFEDELDPIDDITKQKIIDNPLVMHVGFMNDVRPYLCLSDCLVFPSYREGLPNVPLQAACLNLPIIASDINGCNEIVQNGVNGLLVKPKSTDDLKNKMLELFANNEYRLNIKKCTRDIIISKFEQKVVWENLMKEYNKLLN